MRLGFILKPLGAVALMPMAARGFSPEHQPPVDGRVGARFTPMNGVPVDQLMRLNLQDSPGPAFAVTHLDPDVSDLVQTSEFQYEMLRSLCRNIEEDLGAYLGKDGFVINTNKKELNVALEKHLIKTVERVLGVSIHQLDETTLISLIKDKAHQLLSAFVSRSEISDRLRARIVVKDSVIKQGVACQQLGKYLENRLNSSEKYSGHFQFDATSIKDYYAAPKANGYRAYHFLIHLYQNAEYSETFEIQITGETDLERATQGTAAHDHYRAYQHGLCVLICNILKNSHVETASSPPFPTNRFLNNLAQQNTLTP